MSQISRINVHWTPETSPRVSSIQIQSRVVGTAAWTEQAAAYNAAAGIFTFASDAPSTDVEVQVRYRMTDGVYSPWVSSHIVTANAVVEYATISNKPTKLSDIDQTSATKLGGIAEGADKTSANTSKDTLAVNGVAASSITTSISTNATDVAKAKSDIADEIARAKGAEGTINTTIYNLRTDVNNNSSAISNETTQRVANGVSLASQIQNVSTAYQNADSNLSSRITDVSNSLSTANQSIAQRTTTLEASLQANATAITTAKADIANEAVVRANAVTVLGSRVDTVSASINGVSANTVVNAGAISTLQGKTAAYWQATAQVSNGNRAQLTVRADNGGAGVDIVGDVNITGGVRIGGSYATSLAGQANQASPITLYDPSGYLYSLSGLTATKTGSTDFQGNIYSREGFTGGCIIQGTLPSGYECFFGLIENRNQNTSYQNINYAWYTDGSGNIRNWEPGNFPYIGNYGSGTNFKIVYDGRTVAYYVENNLVRQLGSGANRTFYAALALKNTGSTYKLGAFGSSSDNSLINADPAYRINQGGTQINGGMIQAYSIDATRMSVSSLSAITGTIGTLRTATSGQRVEISDSGMRIYNSSGVLVVFLGIS